MVDNTKTHDPNDLESQRESPSIIIFSNPSFLAKTKPCLTIIASICLYKYHINYVDHKSYIQTKF